jgi:hypothetical protein
MRSSLLSPFFYGVIPDVSKQPSGLKMSGISYPVTTVLLNIRNMRLIAEELDLLIHAVLHKCVWYLYKLTRD